MVMEKTFALLNVSSKIAKGRTYITLLSELLPQVLPLDSIRAIATIFLDECAQEATGVNHAQAVGVFSSNMKLRLCTFHGFNLKLGDTEHFGKNINPLVFDRILATFYGVINYCEIETRREAMLTIQCFRAYGRNHLQTGKFLKLEVFIDKAIAKFPSWACSW